MAHRGYAAKLYAGAPGSTATTEVTLARDVTVTQEGAEADDSTRGGGGQGSTAVTLRRTSLEFEMVYDATDDAYGILRDAYDDGSLVALTARDSQDGPGIDGDFSIVNFSNPQPLEGILVVNVTARQSTALRQLTRVGG